VENLRCNGFENPLGVVGAPRLAWSASSPTRNQRQTAWQVLVSSSSENPTLEDADMWDSGKVDSAQSLHIPYAGRPLASHRTYFWKVRCWDQDGRPSEWSEPGKWTTGLMQADEWKAEWIGSDVPLDKGLPIFRKHAELERPVKSAIVSVCGLGHYELFINGKKVEDRFLDPAWSNYEHTAYYNTFDITDHVKQGGNVFGVMLGKGFYNTVDDRRAHGVYYEYPLQFILQATIEYEDGSSETILSDGSWKTITGPILHDAILGGTDYDARRLPAGWLSADFDDGDWGEVVVRERFGAVLRPAESPPMMVFEIFDPLRVDQPEPGVFVYVFGQNASAKPRIRVSGKAGQTIRLKPAEQRAGQTGRTNDGTGRVNQAGVGNPNYWEYTLRGDGDETWTPPFNYSGYQYLEVTGAVPEGTDNPEGLPVVKELQSLHVRNASPVVGTFSCSMELFNDIHQLVDWAVRSNMAHVLTDCPHREKLGWLEVSHLMGPSIAYGYDIENFYSKITRDIRDTQADSGEIYTVAPYPRPVRPRLAALRYTPEWGAAGVILPWQLYQWYGHREALVENFDMMRGFVDYMHDTSTDLVPLSGLGDWFDYGHGHNPGRPQYTSPELTAMATFFECAKVLAQTAAILDKPDLAERYAALAGDIRSAFNERYFNGSDEYANSGSCQTANGMALALGLAPDEHRAAIARKVVDELRSRNYQQTSGDVGFRYLLEALMDTGHSDVVFSMINRDSMGSYGGIVKQGWTTMPEAWDIQLGSSLNHCMLGHVQQWFWQDLAGIRPDPTGPGFRNSSFSRRLSTPSMPPKVSIIRDMEGS
jgi:alpha-L-rhamnosidase